MNFDAQVLGSDRPFLLELGARWCSPCKAMAPLLARLAGEQLGALRVGMLDVEDSPEVAHRLGVRGVPTVLLFANGRELKRQLSARAGTGRSPHHDEGIALSKRSPHAARLVVRQT